jgi:hypothetical protein
LISFGASAVKPQTVTRNFLMTSFIGTLVVRTMVCAIVKTTCLVNGLVWVRLVCQVVFGKLRHPCWKKRYQPAPPLGAVP